MQNNINTLFWQMENTKRTTKGPIQLLVIECQPNLNWYEIFSSATFQGQPIKVEQAEWDDIRFHIFLCIYDVALWVTEVVLVVWWLFGTISFVFVTYLKSAKKTPSQYLSKFTTNNSGRFLINAKCNEVSLLIVQY